MKKKYFRWSAIAVGVALVTQAATPLVFAAPLASISIVAPSATPYSVLSISGSGFQPGESVLLIFGLSQATTTADGTGSFSGTSLMVPNVSGGTYVVLALGQTSGTIAFSYFFVGSFFPLASPSTWWTAPGTAVTFSGSGFSPGEPITITQSGSSTPLASLAADSGGGFSGAGSFIIPYTARNSSLTFSVQGGNSGATIPITIGVGDLYPWANPSSWYILPGSSVTFSGGGFGSGEGVSVYYGTSTTALAHATADLTGAFTSTTSVMIPYGTGAALFRVVGDDSGVEVATPITRASFYPTLTPSAYYSAPSGTISLAGSGFVPNEPVNIMLGSATTSVVADGTGAFSIPSVQLPAVSDTTLSVTAVGATSGATAEFVMAMGKYYTWLNLSSWWAGGGTPLTVFGHNFAPGESVVLSTSAGAFATTTVDFSGNFEAVTTVPYAPPGSVTITATGAMSGSPASVDMTVAPVWTDIQLGAYAGAPGTAINFIGSGYAPNDIVEIMTDRTGSATVHTITASGTGTFNDSDYLIPADWTEGEVTFTIHGTRSFDTKTIVYYVTGS
jgi:large repetitive protein